MNSGTSMSILQMFSVVINAFDIWYHGNSSFICSPGKQSVLNDWNSLITLEDGLDV